MWTWNLLYKLFTFAEFIAQRFKLNCPWHFNMIGLGSRRYSFDCLYLEKKFMHLLKTILLAYCEVFCLKVLCIIKNFDRTLMNK